MRGVLLMLFVSAFSNVVFPQTPAFKHYTVKDGLPGGTIYQAIQDNDGYLWFATNQGVSRFDGNSFKNFSKEDGLPDNDIIKIYVDSKNNLWFISMLGIPSVYCKGKIISFPECQNVQAFAEDVFSNKVHLVAGNLYFLGYYESNNLAQNWKFHRHFKETAPVPEVIHNWPMLRYSDANERIYFSINGKHLNCIVLRKNSRHEFKSAYIDHTVIPPFGKVSFFAVNKETGSFVYYSHDSIFLYMNNKFRGVLCLKDLDLNVGRAHDISSMYYENESTLWLSTRNHGLIKISDFTGLQKKIEHFFQNTYCTSFTKDTEGGYWLSTLSNGVYYIPHFDFRVLTKHPTLNSNDAKCIKSVNKQTVITGFADGNIVKINSHLLTAKPFFKWALAKKNSRIMDIFPYGMNLLIGTDVGLYKLAPDESFERMALMPIKSIFVNDKQRILAAVSAGIVISDAKSQPRHIFKTRATCITGYSDTYFWGTLQGLYISSKGVIQYLGARYPEVSGIINHVAISGDSAIWVSTQQGIIILKNNKVRKIGKEDDLPGNTCRHISFDNHTAWVSTDRGVAKIVYNWKGGTLDYKINKITEADGLVSNDVNQTAISNGFVWVATSEGVSYFPEQFTNHSISEPPLYINKILVGSVDFPLRDTITIKPEQQLSVHLSAISYKSGKALRYEYRFLPLSKKWEALENNRVDFTSLPYGNFRLEMRAVDRWGKRSVQPTVVTIINTPPFWRTSWFEVLSYLLSLVLIVLVIQLYSRDRQKKKEKAFNEKKKVLELEMMAFRAQINPHFIFNSLSSIQHHILQSDPESANRYLHKLSTFIRKTLQSSTSPTITLSEEIAIIEIFLDLQKLRFGNRMEYSLTYPEDILTRQLSIPSMIIQPFIENAVKHGVSPLRNKKGYIKINISRFPDRIVCVIEDNGPGINASKKLSKPDAYTSMGSSITEGRIQAINSIQEEKILLDIHDKKEVTSSEEGTIVTLTFMINASHEYKNGNN